MNDVTREPGEASTTSATIVQPALERSPRFPKLAATFELLVAGLLAWGNFSYIPFGNTVGLFLLGSASLWLRWSGWGTIGLQRPKSWVKTLAWGIGLGIAIQALDLQIATPLLARITGHAPELSNFRSMVGNVPQLLFWLAVTWSIAAFGEEMVYRGYILNRAADALGRTKLAWAFAAIFSSALFALTHQYQAIAGMIDIAVFALIPATAYLLSGHNLWIPILAHGIGDTIGFILIFLHRYPGL
jgi:membrane protease YdiL (CAAX protease family)